MTLIIRNPMRGSRAGAVFIACSGVFNALFPLLRPWSDKTDTASGLAEAFGSPWWLVAHLVGAVAFVLLWAGVGLTLLHLGAETFALHAIAGDESTILETSKAIRSEGVQLTVLVLGLLLVSAGVIAPAMAVWRGGVLPRSSTVLLAMMTALYLPHFFPTPPGRIAHGLVTAVAATWLAAALWRAGASDKRAHPHGETSLASD